jgi:uncharacterized ferredoxin-like protein
MTIDERNSRSEYVLSVARAMMAAARTAPKGKGIDNLTLVTVAGDDLRRIGEHMHRYAEELGYMFFHRDAENILASEAVVLIGTRILPLAMDCGMCSSPTCASKPADVPCGFNLTDLGIAVGSACAVAADRRVDSRVMFSAGLVAQKIGLTEGCHATLAIPLSCTGKSPYFDRISTRPAE